MNIDDFSTYVVNELDMHVTSDLADLICEALPVRLSKGDTTLALLVHGDRHDTRVMPYLDLKPYHERYSADKSITLEGIIDDIANDYMLALNPEREIKTVIGYDFDFFRHGEVVIPRLENYYANSERIDKLPHKMIDDMAVTYHIVSNPGSIDHISFPVTYQLLSKWMLTIDDIHAKSVANLAGVCTPKITPLEQVIIDIYAPCIQVSEGFSKVDAMEYVKNEIIPTHFPDLKTTEVYLMTRLGSDYGASVILSGDYQAFARASLKSDYFIVPASPHEVLLVPDRGQDPAELQDYLVAAERELLPEEVETLSHNIYRYDGRKHTIEKVADGPHYDSCHDMSKTVNRVAEPDRTKLLSDSQIISSQTHKPIARFR